MYTHIVQRQIIFFLHRPFFHYAIMFSYYVVAYLAVHVWGLSTLMNFTWPHVLYPVAMLYLMLGPLWFIVISRITYILNVIQILAIMAGSIWAMIYYPGAHIYGSIVFILMVTVSFLLSRSSFYLPYLRPRRHAFRMCKRQDIFHHVFLNQYSAILKSISLGGCFVEESMQNFVIGQEVVMSFITQTFSLHQQGIIVTNTGDGYGIQFSSLNREKKHIIQRIIKNRHAIRIPTNLSVFIYLGGYKIDAVLCDVSIYGCYLAMDLSHMHVGDQIELECKVNDSEFKLLGKILWFNHMSSLHKLEGVGIRFQRPAYQFKREIASMIHKELSV